MNAPPVTLGLYGVFGTGNFGNEATLDALLERLPDDRYAVVVITERADQVRRDRGVAATTLGSPYAGGRWSRGRVGRLVGVAGNRLRLLAEAVRVVGRLDGVAVAGCGPWERLGSGSFGPPWEIWCLALACRLRGKPFLVLHVGAEALSGAGRWLVATSARWSRLRVFRDTESRAALAAMGAAVDDDPVSVDLAFGLTPPVAPARRAGHVVLGVMDYHSRSDERGDETLHDGLVATWRQLAAALVERGHRVTVIGGDRADLAVAERLDGVAAGVAVDRSERAADLVALMAGADVVVGARFHTVIMAMLAATPVVALGYAPKHEALMTRMGLPELHRDIEAVRLDDVLTLVEHCVEHREAVVQRLEERVAAARADLDHRWSAVHDVLGVDAERAGAVPRG